MTSFEQRRIAPTKTVVAALGNRFLLGYLSLKHRLVAMDVAATSRPRVAWF
jgi:hypothetical protein